MRLVAAGILDMARPEPAWLGVYRGFTSVVEDMGLGDCRVYLTDDIPELSKGLLNLIRDGSPKESAEARLVLQDYCEEHGVQIGAIPGAADRLNPMLLWTATVLNTYPSAASVTQELPFAFRIRVMGSGGMFVDAPVSLQVFCALNAT